MPGMLTPAQMAALDSARGPAFDRLFLAGMIQHHRGAVTMVQRLFDTPGAAQDETVFKFASDVSADQSTEIARMQTMLEALTPEEPHREYQDTRQARPQASVPLARRRPAGLGGVRGLLHRGRRRGAGGRHVHHAAEPGSARGPSRRAHERRRSHLEPAGRLEDATVAPVRGSHQLRPRVHRQLRDPGELQRLPGLGHREPREAGRSRRPTSARRRRATCPCTGTCSSSRARDSAAASTAAARA